MPLFEKFSEEEHRQNILLINDQRDNGHRRPRRHMRIRLKHLGVFHYSNYPNQSIVKADLNKNFSAENCRMQHAYTELELYCANQAHNSLTLS
jgi:hypothetical protein